MLQWTLRLFFVLGMLCILQGCASPATKNTQGQQSDSTAAIAKEMAALESTIAGLEEKLHSEEKEHDDHNNATPQEIEILKTLQILNQRLMQLERMIAGGSPTSSSQSATQEVVEKQVIEQARKTLSEHALAGQSFFTAPALIKTTYVEQEKIWNVSITFKKTKESSDILEAQIACSQTDIIDCEIKNIQPKAKT